MFEQFKGMATGTQDSHGKDVKEGQTLRWMGEDRECYKGVVEYGECNDDSSPFIAGFGIFKTANITDEVTTDEEGKDGFLKLKGGWNGELEIIEG